MITLSSQKTFYRALGQAHSITIGAYMLEPGRVTRALEAAARRGADVVVRLEEKPSNDPTGALARQNERIVKELRSDGADAAVIPQLHIKTAICDGAAYLDDRNFPSSGADTILRDDTPADVADVVAALNGLPASPKGSISITKAAALNAETKMLREAIGARRVEVQSESFGGSSGVYGALRMLAARGVQCKLSVAKHALNPKEALALEKMQRAGVEVRIGTSDEKMALVDGTIAWVGSANATSPFYGSSDWGLCTSGRCVVNAVQRHFDANWNRAQPFIASPAQKANAHSPLSVPQSFRTASQISR